MSYKLPIDKIEKKGGDTFYYFNVPLKAPEGEFEDHIPIKVAFERHFIDMAIMGSRAKSNRVLKGDSSIVSLIQKGYKLWNDYRDQIPDTHDGADALKLVGYEISFRALGWSEQGLQNFNDRSIPTKIINTVEDCTIDFIEKYPDTFPDIDFLFFSAYKKNREQILLHDKFSRMMGEALDFSVLHLDGQFYEFLCINPEKLKDIVTRLNRIADIVSSEDLDSIEDGSLARDLIQDIADGKRS